MNSLNCWKHIYTHSLELNYFFQMEKDDIWWAENGFVEQKKKKSSKTFFSAGVWKFIASDNLTIYLKNAARK